MYHYGYWGYHGFWGFGWIAAIILIIPFWKICTRVGHSPWLSLLLIVPLANVIFVYWLAFSAWPGQRGGAGPGATGFPPGPGTGGATGPTGPGPIGPGTG